ncbi:MAG: hypothetical protein RRA51_01680 [Armatimonadota bacterium]|nr:hypothetical protein [Armatimonadota bacterium]
MAPPIAKRQRLAISNLLEWLSATTKVISRDEGNQPRRKRLTTTGNGRQVGSRQVGDCLLERLPAATKTISHDKCHQRRSATTAAILCAKILTGDGQWRWWFALQREAMSLR